MSFYSKTLEASYAKQLDKELRASHAGETGAVWIYRGALCAEFILSLFKIVRSTSETTRFIHQHLKTEKHHLDIFENELPRFRGSFILPLWIGAGFMTGFIPRLLGENWFFYTIYCVEQFVDTHYENQCSQLVMQPNPPSNVIDRLKRCQMDEQHHRDEAGSLMAKKTSLPMKLWGHLVNAGSSTAVSIARFI
jgi:ubiquinone biosynthesis monooxygenase Coq7|tara:strand:- start:1714 stop:2292 length:579 start_codon:yes stop_codon:yes gene_type:complete